MYVLNKKFISGELSIFTAEKNLSVLHGCVFRKEQFLCFLLTLIPFYLSFRLTYSASLDGSVLMVA